MPKAFCKQSKQLIASLITFFERERDKGGPFIPFNAVQERVAAALNIHVSTISKISQCMKANQPLTSPVKTRKKAKPIRDLEPGTETSIRDVIYEMYRTKQHITRRSLLQLLKKRNIFNGSLTSLGLVLKNIGVKWRKDDPHTGLVELPRIVIARVDFLQQYVHNMKNHFWQLVYLDVTWIFENGSVNWSWQNKNVETVKKVKSDGKRYIVVHAGNMDGFIPGASLIFSSSTRNPDYHGEMNEGNFLTWFKNQLLKNLEHPSMIVMDNASYHSTVVNKSPTSSWKKGDIQAWLHDQGITFEDNLLKPQLLQLALLNKPRKVYAADKLAEEYGHKVLRLPPYHCVFNPIEHIWGIAKTYYNRHIGRNGGGFANCIKMWEEALSTITTETWRNTIKHTEKEIQIWWDREVGFDRDEEQQFIINLNDDSDTDEWYDDDDDDVDCEM